MGDRMINVKFSDLPLYEYVKAIADEGWQDVFSAHFIDSAQVVDVERTELARLLMRLNKLVPTVIPYISKGQWFWIVTAPDVRALDKTIRRVGHFVIPSYAEILDTSGIAQRQRFDPEKGGFNLLGQQLFPHGFYLFRSPQGEKDKIFEALDLWMGLEDVKPAPTKKDRPSYFDLHHTFQDKLAAGNWAEAQKSLDSIRRLSLSTADNISFLRIQLWGAQKDWGRIWDLPDYPELSKLTMPRYVRAHMLSAFYWQVLQPHEYQKNIEIIFQVLDDYRSKLGRLLTGRFGIAQPEVLRVFAYLATKDQNREGLKDLRAEAQSAGLQEFMDDLESKLPIEPITLTTIDPMVQVRQALLANDYDSATRSAAYLSDSLDQAFLYIQIAVLSGDQSAETINSALQAHDALNEDQQNMLIGRYPQTSTYLRFLENIVNQPEFLSSWDPQTSEWRLQAWKVITEFEIRLRKMVEKRYRHYLGREWWSLIDPEFLERWQKASEYKLDPETALAILDYSYLSDLDKLTRRKWELFQDALGESQSDRTFFKKSMEKIITIRNTLAHNRDIKIDDLKVMVDYGVRLIKKVDKVLVSSSRTV